MSFKEEKFKDVIAYYDETRFDYDAVWLNKENLAVHFGFYDENASNHAKSLANTNVVLSRMANIQAGDRVLDAGCGKGGSSFWLARNRQARCTGITPVQSQIDDCNKFRAEFGLEEMTDFVQGDYCNTPFEDNTFDVVWACESVCHAVDKSLFYKEAARVLKPGGRLIMAEYIRWARPLSPAGEQRIDDWLHRWAIDDIDTALEHRSHSELAGFNEFTMHDVTKYTRVSLRNLYHQTKRYLKLGYVLNKLKIRSDVAHGNHVGSYHLWGSLEAGDWFYGVVVAKK